MVGVGETEELKVVLEALAHSPNAEAAGQLGRHLVGILEHASSTPSAGRAFGDLVLFDGCYPDPDP